MAIMIDPSPREIAELQEQPDELWAGEEFVYSKFKEFLSDDDYVCYYHRSVPQRFDFCLLRKHLGFIMIEVKGWHVSHIKQVISENKIELKGYDSPSPLSQAEGYKNALKDNKLRKDQLDTKVNVFTMVCYPFLSEKEYYSKQLNKVSDRKITILKEDFESPEKLKVRIEQYAFDYLDEHKKYDNCKGAVYDQCRRVFEPSYCPNIPSMGLYSKLSVYTDSINEQDVKGLISEWSNYGVKQVIFVHSREDIELIESNLIEEMRRKKLVAYGSGDINYGEYDDTFRFLKEDSTTINIFRFQVIMYKGDEFNSSFCVLDGHLTETQIEELRKLEPVFNLNQFVIEHAPVDKHICVSAGAGTGKTYSMVSRIAYICHNASGSGVEDFSKEIAMLTFTDAAAAQMKTKIKRLFSNMFYITGDTHYIDGIENVENMQVSTIHGFARRIIRNAAPAIGIGSNFTTLNSYYMRKMFLQENLDRYLADRKADGDAPFQGLDMPVYKLVEDLNKFPSELYKSGKGIAALKNGKTELFGESPEDLSIMDDMIGQVLPETENSFSDYLTDNNYVLLEQYTEKMRTCVESEFFNPNLYGFRYVFIDEFQDTDDEQIDAFLMLQEKLGFRFFIVGDLKQSIYRFRGATMKAFDRIILNSEDWFKETLNINYRSETTLLDSYEPVFKYLGTYRENGEQLLPYDPVRDKLAGIKAGKRENFFPEYVQYKHKKNGFWNELNDNIERELWDEANRIYCAIRENISNDKINLDKDTRTIAILTRTNSQADKIRTAISSILSQKMKKQEPAAGSIRLIRPENDDLYNSDAVRDLMMLMGAMIHPRDLAYLYTLISQSGYVSLTTEINPVSLGNSDKEKTERLIAILDGYFKKAMGDEWNWSYLIERTQKDPILKILYEIYIKTRPWCSQEGYGRQKSYRDDYDRLFDDLAYKTQKGYMTLDSLYEALRISKLSEGNGNRRQILTAEEDDGHGIYIVCTTVHKSKGLQYGTVMLPCTYEVPGKQKKDLTVNCYEESEIGYCLRYYNTEYYNNIYRKHEIDQNESIEAEKQDEVRILYVAMTRAIHRFIVFMPSEADEDSWADYIRRGLKMEA